MFFEATARSRFALHPVRVKILTKPVTSWPTSTMAMCPFTLFLSVSIFLSPLGPYIFPSLVSRCSYRVRDFSSIEQPPYDNYDQGISFMHETRVCLFCVFRQCKSTVSLISRALFRWPGTSSIRNRVIAWINRHKRAEKKRERKQKDVIHNLYLNGTLNKTE